jgi:integrative and conjugative element protein (TIGR02256 family)
VETDFKEFNLTNSGVLKITAEVVTQFNNYAQRSNSKTEAGGVLIGRYIISSNNIVVDSMTKPFKKDKRGRFFFKKLDKLHQKVIRKLWKASEGTANYLGEWHTHPESDPSPSSLDIQEWMRKSKEDIYDNDFLIFIIVGTESINAWLVRRSDQKVEKLKEVNG